MSYSFSVKGLVFNDYKERRELVESIDRLETWLFDEVMYYQKDNPSLLKQIKKTANKFPINL